MESISGVLVHPVITELGNQIQISKMKYQSNENNRQKGTQNLSDNNPNNHGAAYTNLKLANDILYVNSTTFYTKLFTVCKKCKNRMIIQMDEPLGPIDEGFSDGNKS